MMSMRRVAGYGATYPAAIALEALQRAHQPLHAEPAEMMVDGNVAAVIAPMRAWTWRLHCSGGTSRYASPTPASTMTAS